jgi:hypothetical protein
MIENNKKREMSIKVTALGLSTHKAKIMENLEIASHFIQQAAKTGMHLLLGLFNPHFPHSCFL